MIRVLFVNTVLFKIEYAVFLYYKLVNAYI